ncbi:unnamed protein product [Clavelina lepadiformis]|uniref:Secreted frizzled-related protein 3 n=2 Tax=Clavelina lepadiformis TaxID=159417 RepID=A0ABP0F626_CLALP
MLDCRRHTQNGNLFLPLLFCLIYWFTPCLGSSCEEVQVPLCISMPWNRTKMPNLLYHSSQQNAGLVLSQYDPLWSQFSTSCKRKLKFFLCSMLVPMCFYRDSYPETVRPCKSVCQEARLHCGDEMRRYNVTWPSDLPCHSLPEYHKGMCVTPEAFVRMQPKPKNCRCSRSKKPSKKQYVKSNFDYVIQARVLSIEDGSDGSVARVSIKSVLKQNAFEILLGDTNLHFSNSCACPKLRRQKNYLIMGPIQSENERLLLDQTSVATKWKKKWLKKIKQWEKKRERYLARQRRKKVSKSKKSETLH